nr:peptidase M17 [Treponema socranskii]
MKDIVPAEIIVRDVCRVKKGERVLIVANPETNMIAQDLFEAVKKAGGVPVLMFQTVKNSFDNASPEVLASIATNPDLCFSVSSSKLGKDPGAAAHPYVDAKGTKFMHIFDFLLNGKKSMRAVWMPGITQEMYERAVQIDYKELASRCAVLKKAYEKAVSVHVTSPGGTDVVVPVAGRKAFEDDGDFSKLGSGGNIPAGEVFISPVVGTGNVQDEGNLIDKIKQKIGAQSDAEDASSAADVKEENLAPSAFGTNGKIVFDGSMTFGDGDALLETPIVVQVADGFVTDIEGGEEAARLKKTIADAEAKSLAMEKEGKLPEGEGSVYRRNARNIGELGIGLNPAAVITGNMLEDEKAFRTCHFAIGENYDSDAPALIHLDGVVREPTIEITYEDGSVRTVLRNGDLML